MKRWRWSARTAPASRRCSSRSWDFSRPARATSVSPANRWRTCARSSRPSWSWLLSGGAAGVSRADRARKSGGGGYRCRPAAVRSSSITRLSCFRCLRSAPGRSARRSPAVNSRCWRSRARSWDAPQLLLLDEPSLGLAPKLVDEVLKRIRTIVAGGTSVLLAEQNVTKALACCERAYLLAVGTVALAGTAADFRAPGRSKTVSRRLKIFFFFFFFIYIHRKDMPWTRSRSCAGSSSYRSVECAGGFGGPYGTVIVKDGEIVGEAHDEVLATHDKRAQDEVLAIRRAGAKLKSFDLSGCEMYVNGTPCCMCMGSILWARIAKVYYALSPEASGGDRSWRRAPVCRVGTTARRAADRSDDQFS